MYTQVVIIIILYSCGYLICENNILYEYIELCKLKLTNYNIIGK